MKLAETMIAWTPRHDFLADRPTFGRVEAGPHPDRGGWSRAFFSTGGACMSDWREADEAGRLALLFILFNTLVIRDEIDPAEAHRAFLAIDEYRAAIPPDQAGADP